MAQIITLRWKLRQGVAPAASDREDHLFNVSRLVKVEPSPSGPASDDADIESKVVYNELGGGGVPNTYYCTDTVAEILALANA